MDVDIAEKLRLTIKKGEDICSFGDLKSAEESYSAAIYTGVNSLNDSEGCHDYQEITKLVALAYNNRGYVKYLRVDFDAAILDYTASLQYYQLPVAYYNRGLIHYRMGRFEEATKDQEQATNLDSSLNSALECLQQCRIEKQNSQTENCMKEVMES